MSSALLYAICCFVGWIETLASFTHNFACKDGSAYFMLLIACNSFFPCFDINIIFAYHKDLCKFLGTNDKSISVISYPYLNSAFYNAALK
jgi:hypothetical protein